MGSTIFAVLGLGSVVSAQEGGLPTVFEDFGQATSSFFGPAEPGASSTDTLEEPQEEPNQVVIESHISPPPAPTYKNGFTEGDVLDSSGVPTYSDEKFVPTGPNAPKEGEINPCVLESDIDACEREIFNKSWMRLKLSGEDWDEFEFEDDFLGWPVAPMWVNKSTGEAILPGNTSYYLNYNIHKYATPMISEGNPFVYYSNLYESDVVRFTPMFEVKNSGYFHRANEEMFPMTAEATFTFEVSGVNSYFQRA